MRTPFDTSKTSKSQESDTSSILAKFQKKNRGDTTFQLISTTQISKQKQRFEKTSNFKNRGRRHSIDTHKTKFLRKKQGGDIQSILAPKSARKRHSIDTRNRMSKEATFHQYLQYHSAGRRLLVDTCTLKTKKPGFYAKNLAFMPKTWLSCQK